MKIIRPIFLLVFTFYFLPSSAQGDTSYLGTDFWVAFMPNAADGVNDIYSLAIVAQRTCSVTITVPAGSFSHTLTATGGNSVIYQLPATQAYQAGSCVVNNTGVHVVATDSIYLFAQNRDGSPNSADATAVMPTHALGSRYVLQTYPVNRSNANVTPCFSILATQNNTRISMTLTGATSTGVAAGSTVDTVLGAGQVFQVKGPGGAGDFSGSFVCSSPGKPVAVFAGNTVAYVPEGGIGGDHVFMQMPPVERLGDGWLLTPTYAHGQPGTDRVRVTAVEGGTYLQFGNQTPINIADAGGSYEFTLTEATWLTSTKPALVCQYMDSRHNTGQGQDFGDPAGFVVTPLNQAARSADFGTMYVDSRSPAVSKYYVNIAVPTAETSLVRLDGQPVAGFQPVAGSSYSHARCTVSTGRHTVTTTGTGFTAHHYGVGENWDSYDVAVGGRWSQVTNHWSQVSGVWDTIDTVVCAGHFSFRGETYSESGVYMVGTHCGGGYVLRLTLGGGSTLIADTFVCDSLVWRGRVCRTQGYYYDTVAMPDGCDSVFVLSLMGVYPSTRVYIDTATCDGMIALGDTLFLSPGHHEFHRQTMHGCDSIVTLDLVLNPHYDIGIDTTICHQPFGWDDSLLTLTGESRRYRFVYRTMAGCDSIVTLTVRYVPAYDSTWFVTIGDTDSYTWVDGQVYVTSTDTTLVLRAADGCDSLLRLVLSVVPHLSDPFVWVPNVFTPDEETNNRFSVICVDLREVTVAIYNRWGNFVCRFDGLTESWDGTKEGQPCKQDTYVYVIRSVDLEGMRIPEKFGTVTLLR